MRGQIVLRRIRDAHAPCHERLDHVGERSGRADEHQQPVEQHASLRPDHDPGHQHLHCEIRNVVEQRARGRSIGQDEHRGGKKRGKHPDRSDRRGWQRRAIMLRHADHPTRQRREVDIEDNETDRRGVRRPGQQEFECDVGHSQRIGAREPASTACHRVGTRDHGKRHAEQRGDEHIDPEYERRGHRPFPAPILFPRRTIVATG